MTPNRDKSARWWRQVGFWGLTINAIVGFPLIAFAVIFRTETDVTPIVIAFGSVLTAWLGCAGIRQWGKNNGSEDLSQDDGLGDE